MTAGQLSTIASAATRYPTPTQLLGESAWDSGAARTTFHRHHIGKPGRWHQILRTISIANVIQRQPATSIAGTAERFGFYDAAALRTRLRTVIGATPTDVRNLLGWEWMLGDALHKAGIRGNAAT